MYNKLRIKGIDELKGDYKLIGSQKGGWRKHTMGILKKHNFLFLRETAIKKGKNKNKIK